MTGLDMGNLDHFGARVLQDAFQTGMAIVSIRRAEEFEAARSRPGDYLGDATPADIAERDRQLTAIAQAHRARAALAVQPSGEIAPFILDVLDEVA